MTADTYYLSEGAWRRGRNLLAAAGALGWAAAAAGWAADPRQFHASYLVSFLFFLLMSLGAMFFVMIQHLTGSSWSVTARRLMENLMVATPVAALLFIPVLLGIPVLYEWSHPEFYSDDPVLQVKMAFFNRNFYLARMVIYFTVWTVLAVNLWKHSTAARKATRWSAPGTLALMVTVTMASVDWLMSLDPHWYSTIFGVYVFSGGALGFIGLLILIALGFRRAGLLRQTIHLEHYHDLGKWQFALTVWWAYIAFSQYMLIWYANLPEETIWFQRRFEGNWIYISGLQVARFAVPFVLLLARAAKRNLAVLGIASVWTVLLHWVDLHWVVMPTVHKHGFHLHWQDLATLVAVGAVFGLAFWWPLRRHAMVPVGDLRLEQGLRFRNI